MCITWTDHSNGIYDSSRHPSLKNFKIGNVSPWNSFGSHGSTLHPFLPHMATRLLILLSMTMIQREKLLRNHRQTRFIQRTMKPSYIKHSVAHSKTLLSSSGLVYFSVLWGHCDMYSLSRHRDQPVSLPSIGNIAMCT